MLKSVKKQIKMVLKPNFFTFQHYLYLYFSKKIYIFDIEKGYQLRHDGQHEKGYSNTIPKILFAVSSTAVAEPREALF